MAGSRVAPITVRLRPAPVYDPPYDDERPPEWWGPGAVQPLLDLHAPPSAPPPAGPARPARAGTASPGAPPGDATPPGATPPATTTAARFVNTCLEILNGYRPVTHFRVLASPLEAASVLDAMTQAFRRLRMAGPRPPIGHRERLVTLRTMRTCQPRPGVLEIAAVVGTGSGRRGPVPGRSADDRVWALAYRLERRHGRWLCTAARML